MVNHYHTFNDWLNNHSSLSLHHILNIIYIPMSLSFIYSSQRNVPTSFAINSSIAFKIKLSLATLSRIKKTQPHLYDSSRTCHRCNTASDEIWVHVFLCPSQIGIFQQWITSFQQCLTQRRTMSLFQFIFGRMKFFHYLFGIYLLLILPHRTLFVSMH